MLVKIFLCYMGALFLIAIFSVSNVWMKLLNLAGRIRQKSQPITLTLYQGSDHYVVTPDFGTGIIENDCAYHDLKSSLRRRHAPLMGNSELNPKVKPVKLFGNGGDL